jgi:hypothetical protein
VKIDHLVKVRRKSTPALYASRMLVNVEQLQEPEHRDAWKD